MARYLKGYRMFFSIRRRFGARRENLKADDRLERSRVGAWLLGLSLVALLSSSLKAAPPAWWTSRGALNPALPMSDYSLINQGQLKQLATQARAEMEARLPGGAGPEIAALIAMWQSPFAAPAPQPMDYATVNRGQLKSVARLFFKRLAEVGYIDAPVASGRLYPWTSTAADDDDFSYANIGQAKQLFSFDFATDTDGDGMPDWWERSQGLVLSNPADAGSDPDSDGLTNLQEFRSGRKPHSADSDLAGQQLFATPSVVNVSLEPSTQTTRAGTLFNISGATINYVLTPSASTMGDGPYTALDSDASGGPLYTWNDISSAGIRMDLVSGVDEAFEQIGNIGFPFPFYGRDYTSAWVTSNGYLTLGSQGSVQYNVGDLPGTVMPLLLIAPYFADLDEGEIYYLKEPGKLTIQFEQARDYAGTDTSTFQVVLEESGAVTFYYKAMSGQTPSWRVGVQNDSNPLKGTQVSTSQGLHNALAVKLIRPTGWVTIVPSTGTLLPGASTNFTLNYTASAQQQQTLRGTIALKNNLQGSVGPAVTTSLTVPPLPTDSDGDGLSNQSELVNRTDPFSTDTNGDGISDQVALSLGAGIATNFDLDGDGISNAQEILNGTNPFSADTDGDGVNDRLDPLPLDPSVFSLTAGVAGAPVLTLLNPPGAQLVP